MSRLIRQIATIRLLRLGELVAAKVDVAEREIRRRIVRPAGDQFLQEISSLARAPEFLERRGGHYARVRLRVGAGNGRSIEERS